MNTVNARNCAVAFVEEWILPYGMPDRLLTENGPQFVEEFFAFVFSGHPNLINKGQIMTQVMPHPMCMVDTEIPLAELLGVTGEGATDMYPHHFILSPAPTSDAPS